MKKILLMLVMLLVLVGCSNGKSSTEETTDPEKTQTSALWSDELLSDGVISVGVSPDYPPYEGLSESGELEGFDIEFMQAVVDQVNANNGTDVKLEWVQMEFSAIITALQMGQLDFGMSGFTFDEERDVLYSTPYIDSSTLVITNGNEDIKSIADLTGKVIGVQLGSTGEIYAKEIENAEVVSISDVNVLVESLKANAYDAVALDQGVAMNYVENAGFTLVDGVLADESMFVIAKNGQESLMDEINKAIEEFKASDAYTQLLAKWGL
ncbi:MAG: transporter substrate-binding domain-containing protein [Anaerorhabdus sp.]